MAFISKKKRNSNKIYLSAYQIGVCEPHYDRTGSPPRWLYVFVVCCNDGSVLSLVVWPTQSEGDLHVLGGESYHHRHTGVSALDCRRRAQLLLPV